MAASSARLLPLDTPTPSMAVPELHMMAFTSAKSTLTRPGMVMMSEMPCTPCAAHCPQCGVPCFVPSHIQPPSLPPAKVRGTQAAAVKLDCSAALG